MAHFTPEFPDLSNHHDVRNHRNVGGYSNLHFLIHEDDNQFPIANQLSDSGQVYIYYYYYYL